MIISEGIVNVLLPTVDSQVFLWAQIICLWMLTNYYLANDKYKDGEDGGNDQQEIIAEESVEVLVEQTKTSVKKKQAKDKAKDEADTEDDIVPKESNADERETGKLIFDKNLILRTLFCAFGAFMLPGFNWTATSGRFWLAFASAVFCVLLPWVSTYLAANKKKFFIQLIGEWELLGNAAFVTIAGLIIAKYSLQSYSEDSLITLPVPVAQLSISYLVVASMIFLTGAGTKLTRGILIKTGTAPKVKISATSIDASGLEQASLVTANNSKAKFAKPIDTKEFNRGKYIGNLERLLVFAVVLVGSYETIGFIIAGKGLIRAKEFEERDFAEYFLIGTLTSTSIAIAVGLVVKFAITKILGS